VTSDGPSEYGLFLPGPDAVDRIWGVYVDMGAKVITLEGDSFIRGPFSVGEGWLLQVDPRLRAA
jgi:hypothetical protein